MKKTYSEDALDKIQLVIEKPCIIFLYGDLGAGKTTFSKMLIQNLLNNKLSITSPTYVYYNKYEDIYHFDLYRLGSYDEFISIAGEEILDNNTSVILIEWPEKIEEYYTANIEIYFKKTHNQNEREIEIIYKK